MSDRLQKLAELDGQLLAGLSAPSEGDNEIPLRTICTDYRIASNIAYALNTGAPEFADIDPGAHGRTVSICGSAPSLKQTWRNLAGDVWACNDAGWFLLDQGIVPRYVMVWDPQPLVVDCLRRTDHRVLYLVASMCDPSVFDLLQERGCNFMIWHPWMGDALPMIEWLAGFETKSRLLIGEGLQIPGHPPDEVVGTSAAVTRSAQFAPLMGYRDIHLHGIDSSCEAGVVHFDDLEIDREQMRVAMRVGLKDVPGSKRPFVTTPQMRRQIKEFIPLVNSLHAKGCRVTVHGNGAIPWLAMLKGWHANSVRH